MPLVVGVEQFKEAMSGHEGKCVLIDGGACSTLFEETGDSFRVIKDLDMVVLVDGVGPFFGRAVWEFVRAGGYESGKRKEGGCTYCRSSLPKGGPNAGRLSGLERKTSLEYSVRGRVSKGEDNGRK